MLALGLLWRGYRRFSKDKAQLDHRHSGDNRYRLILVASIASIVGAALWYAVWPILREASVLSVITILLVLITASIVMSLMGREVMRMRANKPGHFDRLRIIATTVLVLAIAAAAGGYSLYAATVYLDGIPHVQDSVSYLLAAKGILAGHLRTPIDPELAPFFELGHFFRHRAGYLYPLIPGYYFAGHPSLLAVGLLIDAPWLVNPISSAITLALLFILCRELFGTPTGLIAVVLGALSPFARFQAASMMTHPSSLLLVTTALLFLVYWLKRRQAIYALGVGLALGALLNVRLYDGLILGGFVGLVLLACLRGLGWKAIARGAGIIAVTAAPFLLLIAWQINMLGAERDFLGSANRTVSWHPENVDATRIRLAALNEDLFGLRWTSVRGVPSTLTLGLLLFAALVVPKTRADWFIVGWALLYPAAYIMHNYHGVMFGPRYWYPSLGGQVVLVARLLQILPALVTRLSCALWPPGRSRRWHWLPLLVGAVPMILIAVPLFVGVLVNAYPHHYRRIYSSDYNGFSRLPQRLLAEQGVTKGLVFLADLPRWQDLLTAIVTNDSDFSGELIFARHIEGRDHVLIKARPKHTPYVMTWNGTEVELSRLHLDPKTNELSTTPLTSDRRDPLRIGESNVFQGLPTPGGRVLVGGIDTTPQGDIYVLDDKAHQILVFDSEGILRRRLILSYSFGPEAIRRGDGIAVDGDGNIYVTDHSPPGLLRFNADGTFAWRVQEAADGEQRLADTVRRCDTPRRKPHRH